LRRLLAPCVSLFVSPIVALVVGCTFNPEQQPGGPSGAGNMLPSTGIGGSIGNPTGSGGTGNTVTNTCGEQVHEADKLPPDILIVLDRSGSMDNDINDKGCGTGGKSGSSSGGCGTNSKWGLMTPAIKQVVAATDTGVNWGLKFFADPGDSGCGVNNSASVAIGAMNGSKVSTAIDGQTNALGGISNGSRTPTRLAINGAVTYLNGVKDGNPKYILLATDGLPNCMPGNSSTGADDSAGAIQAVKDAKTAGIPTFVVGIATTGMGTADTTLSSMANAGGYPHAGSPAYYSVSSTSEFVSVLQSLVGVAATCTFAVGNPPTSDGTTSRSRIDVYGDGTLIPRDTSHANGWDYTDSTMTSLIVYGATCDQIKAGTIKSVSVKFQCIIG
jgi:hypothetical protein